MKILITGAAGFIGFHLVKRLCLEGHQVYGIDSLNTYYDVRLKQARLNQLNAEKHFYFELLNVADKEGLTRYFATHHFDIVIHLAAQAGVRYSLENPQAYIESNLVGFANILECCRHHHIQHLLFASSSSVYGNNKKVPFNEKDYVDHPVSLYAATKKSNELMAHSYAHLYQLPCTGLRFFTVYGPWGRPDMAYFKFVKNILENKPIDVYNHGDLSRDFTYIDDIIAGILLLIENPSSNSPPYALYNIGNGQPEQLMDFIHTIEQALGKKAMLNFLPMQAGDVTQTYADITQLTTHFHYQSQTPIAEGIKQFVSWYLSFYKNEMPTTCSHLP